MRRKEETLFPFLLLSPTSHFTRISAVGLVQPAPLPTMAVLGGFASSSTALGTPSGSQPVNPETQTTNFIILSITSLISALAAGWLSDRFGRKRMVYFSGGFMATVGLIFIITHSLPIILAAGAIFGLGYGAYISVDWALVADVLPSHKNYARDMGIWNISRSLPQVIAPVIGGPLLDHFTQTGHPIIGFQLLFGMAIVYCLVGTVTIRYIRGIKR